MDSDKAFAALLYSFAFLAGVMGLSLITAVAHVVWHIH